MQRWMFLLLLCAGLTALGNAQVQESQPPDNPPKNQAPPRSDRDREAGESSSRDTRIDIALQKTMPKIIQTARPPWRMLKLIRRPMMCRSFIPGIRTRQ